MHSEWGESGSKGREGPHLKGKPDSMEQIHHVHVSEMEQKKGQHFVASRADMLSLMQEINRE